MLLCFVNVESGHANGAIGSIGGHFMVLTISKWLNGSDAPEMKSAPSRLLKSAALFYDLISPPPHPSSKGQRFRAENKKNPKHFPPTSPLEK